MFGRGDGCVGGGSVEGDSCSTRTSEGGEEGVAVSTVTSGDGGVREGVSVVITVSCWETSAFNFSISEPQADSVKTMTAKRSNAIALFIVNTPSFYNLSCMSAMQVAFYKCTI